ncbi:uncharacterized protein MYCFIDRAFT_213905 [Pseudocercospora fijiensis CIRAD86]|uniref:Uncharacterized protein n=1 Tax=Pseudocercospora fijiensis (strain CIRAD86) TaxID=383855 RepID=M3B8A0_PSEFD|nr:uncharacterized protein MYCFIDRAFT_213905 [Pseudocercospora fijiensis CIRAD86]EME85552.1 hypothetical protein MYCFIDRAFT_213905 [Pseudocercospora fijiensis CIRAD86]
MTSIPKFTSFKAKPKSAASERNDVERNGNADISSDRQRSNSGRLEEVDDRPDLSCSPSDQGSGAKRRHRSPRADNVYGPRRREGRDSDRRKDGSERPHRNRHSRRDRREHDRRHDKNHTPEECEESDLFLIDRRGDAKNVEYGSLHRYSIPQHRRVGFGFVVGLPVAKIDREASTDKETVFIDVNRSSEKQPRALTSTAAKAQDAKLRLVVPAGVNADGEKDRDFICLTAPRKRKRDADVEEGTASDAARDEEDDLRVRQQTSVLSKQAKASATDLGAWLALAEHQAKLVRPRGSRDGASFSASERRALADLRLSILNEASKHIVTGNAGREALLLAIMEEGRHIWDAVKLDAKWHETLKECSSSILLCTKYLDFVQHDSVSFRYETCKAAYIRCLHLLRDSQATSNAQHREELGTAAVYIFLRFTTFLRDAGFDELAIASWQAMLEYHLFMPAELVRATSEDKIASFEEYWDSEVPRIGEEHSSLWCEAHEKHTSAARALPTGQTHMTDSVTSVSHLADEEARLLGRLVLPATMDDDSLTDPFRHVMFSDIRESLVDLNVSKASLINAFLTFARLPNLPSLGHDLAHLRDPHLAAAPAALLRAPKCAHKLRARLETISSLFEDGFDQFQALVQETHDEDLPRFVDRVLESFAHLVDDDELRGDDDHVLEYHLAFKRHLFPDGAPKHAKRLLKGKPSSLRLYNAYALIEASLGRAEKADTVWKTALRMSDNFDSKDDMILLWHSRLVATVRRKDTKKALCDLLSTSNDIATAESKAQHLQMRRELESGFDRAMLSGHFQRAALYGDLLAWLAYLAGNNGVTKAIALYRHYDVVFTKQDNAVVTRELMHQFKASMMHYHLDCQKQYRPSALRHECESSLELFPSNSILLDLHQRLQTQDRLRTTFEDQKHSSTKPTVIEWSHRLNSEIHRNETYGTTGNVIRATFSKALLHMDSNVRHSPALWLTWFNWELGRLESESKAKQVFLDGLRHLPWCKFWIILGMQHLRDSCSDRELRQWHGVMIERGLRARIELE